MSLSRSVAHNYFVYLHGFCSFLYVERPAFIHYPDKSQKIFCPGLPVVNTWRLRSQETQLLENYLQNGKTKMLTRLTFNFSPHVIFFWVAIFAHNSIFQSFYLPSEGSTVNYSPCSHPAIMDTPIIWTAAKSQEKINHSCLTEINSRYYGLSLMLLLTQHWLKGSTVSAIKGVDCKVGLLVLRSDRKQFNRFQ